MWKNSDFLCQQKLFSTVENTGTKPVDIDFALTLPFSVEPESARPVSGGPDNDLLEAPRAAGTPEECLARCNAQKTCASWTLSGTTCALATSVPYNRHAPGAFSGVKGSFKTESEEGASAGPGCITLDRPGVGPAQGGLSACGGFQEGTATVATASSMGELWSAFSKTGLEAGQVSAAEGYGAVAVHAKALAPGEKRVLSITLGWHYPERSYLSERVGNYYTTLWQSSVAAARGLGSELEQAVASIASLHSPFWDSIPDGNGSTGGLPEWLADILVNMLSHIRSAWWEEDGAWRQWEVSQQCPSLDLVKVAAEKSQPKSLSGAG